MDLTLSVSALLLPPYDNASASHEIAIDVAGSACDVIFRVPTAADLVSAALVARTDPARGAAEILNRCILRATLEGVAVAARDLPAVAQDAISEAMAEHDPQAELNLDVCCPACGESFPALFDTATFLLNELEQVAGQLLVDVHTLALHYHWSESEILRMPASRRKKYLAMLDRADPRRRLG